MIQKYKQNGSFYRKTVNIIPRISTNSTLITFFQAHMSKTNINKELLVKDHPPLFATTDVLKESLPLDEESLNFLFSTMFKQIIAM